MCGIVGISYGPDGPLFEDWSPSETLQILLPASVHRGPHAYGWMYCTRDGAIHVSKHVGRSDTPEAIATMVIPPEDEMNILWMVGHVRYATHGSPAELRNNHPIPHGKIVGVHNGVLRNHAEILAETGREDEATEVDSEAIFAAVNKWGHRAGLRRVRGDMVAVYANRDKPEVLHIARTMGRPLAFCHTTGGSLLFASEESIADSTGMVASAFSSLSSQRLVRAKMGKIVERVSLQPVPGKESWRRFSGDDEIRVNEDGSVTRLALPNRGVVNPRLGLGTGHSPRSGRPLVQPKKLQRGRTGQPNQNEQVPPRTALDDARQRAGDVVRPPAMETGYARSATFRDGDRVGSKYYYHGLLLSEVEFLRAVNGMGKSALDE